MKDKKLRGPVSPVYTLREGIRALTWAVRDHYATKDQKPLVPPAGLSPDDATDQILATVIQEIHQKLPQKKTEEINIQSTLHRNVGFNQALDQVESILDRLEESQ